MIVFLRRLIGNHLDQKLIWLLFALTSITYATMMLVTIPKVMHFSNGMQLLDMMPTGYGHAYVQALFDTLGSQGRSAYLYWQIPVDMIYPGLFGISYCLVMAFFLNKLGKLESNFLYLCLIPIFSGIFDYGENIGIIIMLNSYPDNSMIISQVSNIFSILKSTFTSLFFISLILCLMVLGKRKFRPAKR